MEAALTLRDLLPHHQRHLNAMRYTASTAGNHAREPSPLPH